MVTSKKALIGLCIVSFLVGMVGASIVYDYLLKPKIDYSLEENAFIVAYVDQPLDFGTLWLNTSYLWNDTDVAAIQVKRDANITVGLGSINASHFTEFKVEIWNLTATPDYTLVGSFDLLAPTQLNFLSGAADYGYIFYFTTVADAPGVIGQVELEVYFQGL